MFREVQRAFKANRVPRVDQVDKLREHISGFALSLVPDTVKDIEVQSRLNELKKLGKLPGKDSYGNVNFQRQVQWYLTLDGLLQDLIELGERDEDLAVQVFNPATIRDVVNLFPMKLNLELSKLPGKQETS